MSSSQVAANLFLNQLKSSGKSMAVLLAGVSNTVHFPVATLEWITEEEIVFRGPGEATLCVQLPDNVAFEVGLPTSEHDDLLSKSRPLEGIRAHLRSRGVRALQVWIESACVLVCETSEAEAVRLLIQ
jgi:hypothetical protein